MTAIAFLLATAALPTQGRFDLVCSGTRQEAVGELRAPAEAWSGRLAVDLGLGRVRPDEADENLRLLPGPPDRLVVQDEVKGFGDAVVRLEAHVDRATGAYAATSGTEVGDSFRQETTIRAACTVAPFTRLAEKDAPEPVPEPGPPAPR